MHDPIGRPICATGHVGAPKSPVRTAVGLSWGCIAGEICRETPLWSLGRVSEEPRSLLGALHTEWCSSPVPNSAVVQSASHSLKRTWANCLKTGFRRAARLRQGHGELSGDAGRDPTCRVS